MFHQITKPVLIGRTSGLEADQKVIAHHRCYAMTATTALTAQNTQGVKDIHLIPPCFVKSQIDAVFDDIGVDVVKIGMLSSAETVAVVASSLQHHGSPPIVLDPVMVATSGARLLPEEATTSLCEKLLPTSTVLTPNLPEAKLLVQHAGEKPPEIRSTKDLVALAGRIRAMGPKHVLLKGGHLPLTRDGQISRKDADHHVVVNVLHSGEGTILLETDYIASKNTHGTGCSLACEFTWPHFHLIPLLLVSPMLTFLSLQAAIASQMALNPNGRMIEHVKAACRYVEMGIRKSIDMRLGQGSGSINHFHEAIDQASLRTKVIA